MLVPCASSLGRAGRVPTVGVEDGEAAVTGARKSAHRLLRGPPSRSDAAANASHAASQGRPPAANIRDRSTQIEALSSCSCGSTVSGRSPWCGIPTVERRGRRRVTRHRSGHPIRGESARRAVLDMAGPKSPKSPTDTLLYPAKSSYLDRRENGPAECSKFVEAGISDGSRWALSVARCSALFEGAQGSALAYERQPGRPYWEARAVTRRRER